jgi:hypothetical protein
MRNAGHAGLRNDCWYTWNVIPLEHGQLYNRDLRRDDLLTPRLRIGQRLYAYDTSTDGKGGMAVEVPHSASERTQARYRLPQYLCPSLLAIECDIGATSGHFNLKFSGLINW